MKSKNTKPHNKKRHIGYSMMFSSFSLVGISLTTCIVFFVMWFFSSDNTIMLQNMSVLTIFILTLIIGSVITLALRSLFISPLIKLTDAMNKVACGDFSIQLDCSSRQSDLVEIYSSFNTMVRELAHTDTLQTDFISNVSHEFKTPLNAIEGYASLLQDSSLSKQEQEAYVHKIISNTRRLSELVGNVLLLSKITNQSINPKLNRYRLDEQVRQAILSLESKWGTKDIDFDIELEEIEYKGAENLIGHVWTNLIDNAVKFSHQSGEITIRLENCMKNIKFTIRNFGSIIPTECIESVFTKFYQCDTSRQSEGNGLGLALVKRIIDVAKGRIEVESSIGTGTVFTVFLPHN